MDEDKRSKRENPKESLRKKDMPFRRAGTNTGGRLNIKSGLKLQEENNS